MTTKERYRREIEDAIAKVKFSRSRATVAAADMAEAYAHRDGVAWGVNILRGIRRPDGSAIAEG